MKAKTHSGSQKRVKITGTGKFRTAKIGKRHLLQNKSSKAKGRDKYGNETHVANERKMKWAMQVSGLRSPTSKTQSDKTPRQIKAENPRKFPTIKSAVVKQPKAAPKNNQTTTRTTATTAKKATKKAPAKAATSKKAPKAV